MNFEDLEALIDALEQTVRDEHPQKGYWKSLWDQVRMIRTEFKATHFPKAEDRQAAWLRVDSLANEAKARSEKEKAHREEREREWNARRAKSEQALSSIQSKAATTDPLTDFENTIYTLILFPLVMVERALNSLMGLEELDAVHESLKQCSANMKEAWRMFTEAKRDLLPRDRNTAYEGLIRAQERLNAAWEHWKRSRGEYREQQQRAWEQRQKDRAEKHADFVRRVRANISKLEEKIEKAENALQRQRDHLSNLEDQYEEAWNDSFKDRCSDWIDEAKQRIRDIEESIDRLNGWIEEERRKLD